MPHFPCNLLKMFHLLGESRRKLALSIGHLANIIMLWTPCFRCCQISPLVAPRIWNNYSLQCLDCNHCYNIAHEEAPIAFSYMLEDFDLSFVLHAPNTCLHNLVSMNTIATHVKNDASCLCCTLHLNCVVHNKCHIMMDDPYLYHAFNFSMTSIFRANTTMHTMRHIMMDDVHIYHAHTLLCRYT